jgi:outer membrane protein, multidrug efflux system
MALFYPYSYFQRLLLASTLLLCACASAPPQAAPQAMADVPTAWSQTAGLPTTGNAVLTDWWHRFDDPLLHALVVRALAANTQIDSAKAALQQARALRDVASAALGPALGSTLSAQSLRNGEAHSSIFQAALNANWEVDVFGANRSALNATEAALNASAASVGDMQVLIAAEVALDYIALRSAQERFAIATSNLASQTETLQLTQWRVQAGLVTALEDAQARTAMEQTAAQLPALQITMAQTRHALALLTAQPPAALDYVLAASAPVPQPAGNLALLFPVQTLSQRSDVRAAQYRVAEAHARVEQADAARAPNFQLGGSLGLSALTLGAFTDGASIVANLLASVSLPVWDGGARRAQVRAQQAVLAQANLAYRATVLTALAEVEDALVALQGDRERLLRLQNAAAAARTAAQLARQRYDSGLVDFQVVLETQRTRLGTQDNVASAGAAVSADHVRLYQALGGGWLPDEDTPRTPLL